MDFTRGDTTIFKFKRIDANDQVITEEANQIYFTMKKEKKSEEILIKKKLGAGITYDTSDNYYRITINPEDTNELEYGSYFYDIEVITEDYTKTIKKGFISITEESTCACDRW